MYLKIAILAVILLSVAMVGFAVNILFKKNGQFPETSVGKNKELRKKKIYCYKTEQKIIDKEIKSGKNPPVCSC